MQVKYAKASYVLFPIPVLCPLPRRFGPVRAFVRHLDVQLAIRGEDVSGPSVLMLYIYTSLMLINNSSCKSEWEGPAMFITIHTINYGVKAAFCSHFCMSMVQD